MERKNNPKTAPSLTKLTSLFYKAKLKKDVNPDVFITYLEKMRDWLDDEMKDGMTDAQFMVHVLNHLTPVYDYQVTIIEKKLNVRKDNYTLIFAGKSLGLGG